MSTHNIHFHDKKKSLKYSLEYPYFFSCFLELFEEFSQGLKKQGQIIHGNWAVGFRLTDVKLYFFFYFCNPFTLLKFYSSFLLETTENDTRVNSSLKKHSNKYISSRCKNQNNNFVILHVFSLNISSYLV